MIIKFFAYLITESNAIFTDALESIVNVIASAFALFSVHLVSKPKDENHPYGHGKVEFFSVFIEGGLILIAGVLILFKGVYNLIFPHPIHNLLEGSVLIGITGIVNFSYGTYMIKQSKKLNSLTLYGDGKHLQTDAYSTLGLIVGVILMYFTQMYWLDNVISILLGLFITWTGYKLFRKSISGLMDESDAELIEDFVKILNKNRQVDWIDIHNLRIQQYGPHLHLDCHVTLPRFYSLNKVHDVVTHIDQIVNTHQESDTELFIHPDPCEPNCCSYCDFPNCPIRSMEYERKIEWNRFNIIKNAKHFHQNKTHYKES